MIFNANGATLAESIRMGCEGYSGVMANFHPDLLVLLYENYKTNPEKAEKLSNMLSMMAFTENPAYPCTAKYYLGFEGLKMETLARSSDEKRLTEYQKYVVRQMYALNNELRKQFLEG